MKKYVIASDTSGHEHVIVFSQELPHSSAVPAGLKPVSAGFFMVQGGHLAVSPIDSATLNIGPRREDSRLLSQFMAL